MAQTPNQRPRFTCVLVHSTEKDQTCVLSTYTTLRRTTVPLIVVRLVKYSVPAFPATGVHRQHSETRLEQLRYDLLTTSHLPPTQVNRHVVEGLNGRKSYRGTILPIEEPNRSS